MGSKLCSTQTWASRLPQGPQAAAKRRRGASIAQVSPTLMQLCLHNQKYKGHYFTRKMCSLTHGPDDRAWSLMPSLVLDGIGCFGMLPVKGQTWPSLLRNWISKCSPQVYTSTSEAHYSHRHRPSGQNPRRRNSSFSLNCPESAEKWSSKFVGFALWAQQMDFRLSHRGTGSTEPHQSSTDDW